MIFGPTIIILSGVFATTSMLVYAFAGQQAAGQKLARVFYAAMTLLVTAATAYLLYLFITHRFEFQYVFAYSSLDLPLKYTISSFWGGQEGTFLLWLWFGALLGWIIVARSKQYERWAMVYFLAVQIFMIVLLVVRSPALRSPTAGVLIRCCRTRGWSSIRRSFFSVMPRWRSLLPTPWPR